MPLASVLFLSSCLGLHLSCGECAACPTRDSGPTFHTWSAEAQKAQNGRDPIQGHDIVVQADRAISLSLTVNEFKWNYPVVYAWVRARQLLLAVRIEDEVNDETKVEYCNPLSRVVWLNERYKSTSMSTILSNLKLLVRQFLQSANFNETTPNLVLHIMYFYKWHSLLL